MAQAMAFAKLLWLLPAGLLLMPAGPARAMNWEGHDDFMVGFPPGEALLEAIPDARPLPSPDCPVTAEQARKNPYEQIPLPRHRCPATREDQPLPD
jgi:hypothetical protein